MNPNVYAAYALFSRLESHGVTHCVISPGSRSTPLAYAARQLFDTTVVIDERDAGFVALGIAESTGRPPVVITTSGSAPTHLFPSVTEAFHSNVPMIMVTADRPMEVRGRGAPQTIDQINLFGSGVRYFCDSLCPHDETDSAYWEKSADELYLHAVGAASVAGPVHFNMGMREPLVPDGDENKSTDFVPYSRPGLERVVQSPDPFIDPYEEFQQESGAFDPDAEMIIEQSLRDVILQAETVVLTFGRHAGIDQDAMTHLSEYLLWPMLADITSNVRSNERTITSYDSIIRRDDGKNFIPDLVLQLGEPLTSKKWNETISSSQVIGVHPFDDDRDPYGSIDHHIVTRDMRQFVRELVSLRTDPACDFFDLWKLSETQVLQLTEHLVSSNENSEPAFFGELGGMLQEPLNANVLIASSMPIRYAEWFWRNPYNDIRFFSHRGTNGIDGMLSSAYGIAHGSKQPVLCVVGDVAFAHDIGFLTRCGELSKKSDECVVFCVIDNGGGAIFRHLDQANNAVLSDSYDELLKTQPGINIEEISKACGAHYGSGSHEECITQVHDILTKKIAGTHVIHVKVDHESGSEFMAQLRRVLSGEGPTLEKN